MTCTSSWWVSDGGHLFFPFSRLKSFLSQDPQSLSQAPKVLATTPFFSLQSSAAWERSVPFLPFHHVSLIPQLTGIQLRRPPWYWTDLVKGVATIWSLSAASGLAESLCLSRLCCLMHCFFLPSRSPSLTPGASPALDFLPCLCQSSGLFGDSSSCAFS